MMRIWIIGLIMYTSIFSSAASEYKKQSPPSYSKHLREIERNMGLVRPNGLPDLEFPIETSDILELLGVRLGLRHVIISDAYGNYRSTWKISGLQSALTPRARGKLVWTQLSSQSITFDIDDIGPSLSHAGQTNWLIRKPSAMRYDIRAPDGRIWRYLNGYIETIRHPLLGEVKFDTRGAMVRRIHPPTSLVGEAPLLKVTYDTFGRPRSLAVGERVVSIFEWSDRQQLSLWQSSESGRVTFSYKEGLLTKVVTPNVATRWFKWAINGGHERGDSRWPAALHLAEDNENCYSYTLSHEGYRIARFDKDSGFESVTLFNPRRQRLEQKIGQSRLIASFISLDDRTTVLSKIEDGEGQILEQYTYDELGRLVGIERRGEPKQRLSYSQSGRLISVEVGEAQ